MKSSPYARLTAAIPVAAALLLAAAPVPAQDNDPQQLQALRTQMEAMQKQLKDTQAQLDKLAAAAPAANAGGAGLLALGAATGLKFSGDLRLRYEAQIRNDENDANEHRERLRTRFRLGFDWTTADGWTIGAGLATGPATSTSTNETWSSFDAGGVGAEFGKGGIRLDYAYAKHSWTTGTTLTLGQQRNPFLNADTLWDTDVRPCGATIQQEVGKTVVGFLTVGGYDVRHEGRDQADGLLGAAQAGVRAKVADVETRTAVSYYRYNHVVSDSLGLNALGQDYFFELLSGYGEVSYKFGTAGSVKVYGEYTANIGASGEPGEGQLGADANGTIDPSDSESAIVVGTELTLADNTLPDRYTIGYAYARLEADSLYPRFMEGDWGDSCGLTFTDVEGHRLRGAVKLTKNMSVNATAVSAERIQGRALVTHDKGELYQFDLNYKF